jgi:hypothetical protein
MDQVQEHTEPWTTCAVCVEDFATEQAIADAGYAPREFGWGHPREFGWDPFDAAWEAHTVQDDESDWQRTPV